ncbi:MAG: hypothetical protein MJK18_15870 [Bdellovibrionales bacterium]|nr:hypothetical protein [Bdellovibrionales bacterium]
MKNLVLIFSILLMSAPVVAQDILIFPYTDGSARVSCRLWSVDGSRVSCRNLQYAVMDLWGGDPGPICYSGSSANAAKAIRTINRFIDVEDYGDSVGITTLSPFGDGHVDTAFFTRCGNSEVPTS